MRNILLGLLVILAPSISEGGLLNGNPLNDSMGTALLKHFMGIEKLDKAKKILLEKLDFYVGEIKADLLDGEEWYIKRHEAIHIPDHRAKHQCRNIWEEKEMDIIMSFRKKRGNPYQDLKKMYKDNEIIVIKNQPSEIIFEVEDIEDNDKFYNLARLTQYKDHTYYVQVSSKNEDFTPAQKAYWINKLKSISYLNQLVTMQDEHILGKG